MAEATPNLGEDEDVISALNLTKTPLSSNLSVERRGSTSDPLSIELKEN